MTKEEQAAADKKAQADQVAMERAIAADEAAAKKREAATLRASALRLAEAQGRALTDTERAELARADAAARQPMSAGERKAADEAKVAATLAQAEIDRKLVDADTLEKAKLAEAASLAQQAGVLRAQAQAIAERDRVPMHYPLSAEAELRIAEIEANIASQGFAATTAQVKELSDLRAGPPAGAPGTNGPGLWRAVEIIRSRKAQWYPAVYPALDLFFVDVVTAMEIEANPDFVPPVTATQSRIDEIEAAVKAQGFAATAEQTKELADLRARLVVPALPTVDPRTGLPVEPSPPLVGAVAPRTPAR